MTDSAVQTGPALILMAALGLAPSPELTTALEAVPYGLHHTLTVADTLTAVRERSPELLIILTGGFGEAELEVCQTLSQHPQTRWIPILVIGQDQDPMARVQAFQAGIVDYISPALCPAEIIARAQVHINQYRVYQRLSLQAQRA
ncbi:MAG TPA: hypothetical protein IGR64_03905, partial [Leptolyngbyaceae cyanobacterium M65_K2018_010]|nr:hypothetical protein [Leptolyngbyaceae cyanobacterium M65_K2018_010]